MWIILYSVTHNISNCSLEKAMHLGCCQQFLNFHFYSFFLSLFFLWIVDCENVFQYCFTPSLELLPFLINRHFSSWEPGNVVGKRFAQNMITKLIVVRSLKDEWLFKVLWIQIPGQKTHILYMQIHHTRSPPHRDPSVLGLTLLSPLPVPMSIV